MSNQKTIAINENSVAGYCVYAIKAGKTLARLAKDGGKGSFSERKLWKKVSDDLFPKACANGKAMPVLFGNASDCSQLLYWGFLTEVDVGDRTTAFTIDRLRKVRGMHAPQELVLLRSGKKMSPKFIRSYAICFTPRFLR